MWEVQLTINYVLLLECERWKWDNTFISYHDISYVTTSMEVTYVEQKI